MAVVGVKCLSSFMQKAFITRTLFAQHSRTAVQRHLHCSRVNENKDTSTFTYDEDDPIIEDNIERWELLKKVKGVEDPFQLTAARVIEGTENEPTVITTIYDQRTVGCICSDNSVVIKWMKLNVGECKKCECGNWFKLVPMEE